MRAEPDIHWRLLFNISTFPIYQQIQKQVIKRQLCPDVITYQWNHSPQPSQNIIFSFVVQMLHSLHCHSIRFCATIQTHKIVDDLRGLHLVIVHYSSFTVSHKPIFNTSLNASDVKYWVVDSICDCEKSIIMIIYLRHFFHTLICNQTIPTGHTGNSIIGI